MSRIILITGKFPITDAQGFPTGKTQILVDYAFEEDTLKPIIVPPDHPLNLGAKLDPKIGEWVLN